MLNQSVMKLKQENTREVEDGQDDATLPLSSLFSGKHKSSLALNGAFEMIIMSARILLKLLLRQGQLRQN